MDINSSLREQLAMTSSESDSSSSDVVHSSDDKESNIQEVIKQVISNREEEKAEKFSSNFAIRQRKFKPAFAGSYFVPKNPQTTASGVLETPEKSTKSVPLSVSPMIAPPVNYSHSMELLAAQNSDVPINSQTIENVVDMLQEPSMPTPTPPPTTDDFVQNQDVEMTNQPAPKTIPLKHLSSCSIVEGDEGVPVSNEVTGIKNNDQQTANNQATGSNGQQTGNSSDSSRRTKTPLLVTTNDVARAARDYAIHHRLNPERTINHWLKMNVKDSEFVRKTGKKTESPYCFEDTTSRHPPNPDKYGDQHKEYFTVVMVDGSMVERENTQFARHPFGLPPREFRIGTKVVVPEPSENLRKGESGLTYGSIMDRRYVEKEKKWYYKNLEVPECRVFERYQSVRAYDKNITQAKGYSETSITKWQRGQLINLDNDVIMMVALHNPQNASYLLWPIDDYGRLMYYDKNHFVIAVYETIAPLDKKQKELFKLGKLSTNDFSNDYLDLLHSELGLPIEERLKLPSTTDKLSYNRLLTEISQLGGVDNLSDEKRANYDLLKEKFEIGNESFESRLSNNSPTKEPPIATGNTVASDKIASLIASHLRPNKSTDYKPPRRQWPMSSTIPIIMNADDRNESEDTGSVVTNSEMAPAAEIDSEMAPSAEIHSEMAPSAEIDSEMAPSAGSKTVPPLHLHLKASTRDNSAQVTIETEENPVIEQLARELNVEAAQLIINITKLQQPSPTPTEVAPVIEDGTDGVKDELFLEQIGVLANRIDTMNQKIRELQGEHVKREIDEAKLAAKIAEKVEKSINEGLSEFAEKADKKYAQIADMPEAGKRLKQNIMKNIWNMLEDTFFEFQMQGAIAKRKYARDGVPPEGFKDFVEDFANIDLDSIRTIPANERPDVSRYCRFLRPTNIAIDPNQPSTSGNVDEEQVVEPGLRDFDILVEPMDIEETNGNDNVPTSSRRNCGNFSDNDHPEFTDKKKSLIRKILRATSYPMDRGTLYEMNEASLEIVYGICYPEDGFDRPGPIRHDGTPRSPMPFPPPRSTTRPPRPESQNSIQLLSPVEQQRPRPNINVEHDPTSIFDLIDGPEPVPQPEPEINNSQTTDPDYSPNEAVRHPPSPEPTSPAFSEGDGPSIETFTATQMAELPPTRSLRSTGPAPEPIRTITPVWQPLRPADITDDREIERAESRLVVTIDQESDEGEGPSTVNRTTMPSNNSTNAARESLTDDSDSVASTPVRCRIRLLLKRKEKYETRLRTVTGDIEQLEGLGLNDSLEVMTRERARVERMLKNCINDLSHVGRAEAEIPRQNARPTPPARRTPPRRQTSAAEAVARNNRNVARKVIYPSSSSEDFEREAASSTAPPQVVTNRKRPAIDKSLANARKKSKKDNESRNQGNGSSGRRDPTNVVNTLMANPRFNRLFVQTPTNATPTSATPATATPATGTPNTTTPTTERIRTGAPSASNAEQQNRRLDDHRDSMAENSDAAVLAEEDNANVNIPLSEERPSASMRMINSSALEQERKMAEQDKRSKRSSKHLPDTDPERIADKAANFFWRLANTYVNGRGTMMERLNTQIDQVVADDRNPRLHERVFTNLYFRGIYQWMLVFFPVQDTRDMRLYIRRFKFKVKNNINSDRSRQRKKLLEDAAGAGAAGGAAGEG